VRNRSAFRGLPLGGTAAVGVLLGHWLAYTVAFPAAGRQAVLAETGHAYWLSAVRIAVVLLVVGLAVVVGRLARPATADSPRVPYAAMARRLAGVQVGAFAAMELVERLVTGAPLAHLVDHQVFFLGLAAQVVVACAGALLLLWFGRTAEAVVATLRRDGPLPRPASASPRPAVALGHARVAPAGAAGVRGPPRR
jgi:hypothetical protein